MSSTDKKKFEITETSKQAGVDITSDKILLPADSTDHVLVVVDTPIESGTETITTQTINVPAKNNMFFYGTGNLGNQYKAFWETTDNVFDSYDFSSGLSWFYAGSQSYYWYIDRLQVLNLEFTDGSYISLSSQGTHLTLTYRDGSNGAVKYFSTEFQSTLQFLHDSQTSDSFDRWGGNSYESASNQADTYIKKASFIGPNGYKVTASGAYNTQSQSINNLSVSANDGADWAELDFSSKIISKTTLLAPIGGEFSVIRPDILSFASKEITFDSLLVKYDDSGNEITNGTFAIFDAFSKDYDRFFLFGNGAYDSIPITNTINWSDISNIVVKSHDGTVNLDFKAISFATDPVTELTTYYYVYKERTDLPNYINSEGTTERDVLTVSAGSSISGVVNVEVEMSPDGEHWCPVQAKTVVSSAGGSTANTTIVSNLKYVNLEPAGTNLKDRHARGSLSFDINNNPVTYETGVRDMMHQHMDVGKSFNYSQWWKTSHLPTSTYKPVLFRHGGYDNFENTQVVDLTDPVTQNLCNLLDNGNEYALRITNDEPTSASSQSFELTNASGTFINPFKLSTESNLDNLPTFILGTNLTEGVTISANIRVTSEEGTDYNSKALWRIYLNDSQGNPAGVLQTHISLNDHNLRSVFLDTTGKIIYYGNWGSLGGTLRNGNWHHISQSYSSNTTTASTHPGYYWRVSIDGATPAIGSGNNIIQPDWSTYTISKVQLGGNGEVLFDTNGTPTTDAGDYYANLDMDNVCFYTGYINTNNNWTSIYNARKNPLSFSSPNMVLKSCFTMGDQNDDRANFIFKDIVEPSSGRQFVQSSTNAATPAPVVLTLTPSDDPYFELVEANKFSSVFNSTSSFSVSGWFRTEVGATGTLFSNTGGAASTGLKVDVLGSTITASYLYSSLSTTVSHSAAGTFNDGEWHHITMIMSPGSQLLVVDNIYSGTSNHTLTDAELRGSNGFTLLGDGQNNSTATSPSSTDPSKLNATLSNWSIHSETLSSNAAVQLYSNGHVRNIKNLPSINSGNIVAWWQLNDSVNPEQDLSGNGHHLTYQDGHTITETLAQQLVDADGATLVEKSINGNALTLSLTKNFDFVNEEWVTDASGDTAVCMSLNGFEDQAEYFVLWKCSQTFGTDTIDLCDGNWHNLILCYRGASDAGPENEGNIVKFGPQNSSNYNFTLCMDGISLDSINGSVGADFIGGLGSGIVLDNTSTKNAGFPLYNRHLRYEASNTEEEYKPHCQFAPGIYDWSGDGLDDPNNFQGQVDETSFHSDNWWLDSSGQIFENDFNNEKAYTIYGRTNALDNRGDGTDYPRGVPYGLLNPEYLLLTSDINDIAGTNQFINPIRKGDTQPWDSQVSTGGLEGWWRWGDIGTDCSRDINDVKDDADSVDYRDLKVKALSDTNTHDIAFLSTSDSIYLAESTTSSPTAGFEYVNVVLENLTALLNTATCTTKHLSSQIYQYLRIKLTGSGSCDIGDDKLKIEVHHKKRRMK